jgi:CrcB protein
MVTTRIILMIALCGAGGAVMRFLVHQWSLRWFGDGFPLGTLFVNVTGCFLLGGLSQLVGSQLLPEPWRIALGIGFLGGLTTFSTFGYETYRHLDAGNWGVAAASMSANLLVGLAAVWAGVALGMRVTNAG